MPAFYNRKIILLTDDQRLPDPCALLPLLPRGSYVILRHYHILKQEQLRLAQKISCLCHRYGLFFLLSLKDQAKAWHLAFNVRFHGFHWTEPLCQKPPSSLLLWRKQKKFHLTCASHTVYSLKKARSFRPNFILVSPVFKTKSHPTLKGLGSLRFRSLVRKSPQPIAALGGVNHKSFKQIQDIKVLKAVAMIEGGTIKA
jgi:thiamine-phosphate pyrophosphorylase